MCDKIGTTIEQYVLSLFKNDTIAFSLFCFAQLFRSNNRFGFRIEPILTHGAGRSDASPLSYQLQNFGLLAHNFKRELHTDFHFS